MTDEQKCEVFQKHGGMHVRWCVTHDRFFATCIKMSQVIKQIEELRKKVEGL